MRKFKSAIMSVLAVAAVLFLFADPSFYNSPPEIMQNRGISRSGLNNKIDDPQEIAARNYIGSQTRSKMKKRTILIYMNGSDLETEYMAATTDLHEILDSGFDERNLNIIIFAGGAKRWHTPQIPNRLNTIFKIENKKLVELARVGRDPMGYPETLAGFINFAYNLYPAEEYGLILWNHGGGAVVGYGHDERFRSPDKSMMKLSEIEAALKYNDMFKNNKKFEFIGFDTCLMATLEMALVAEKYADYLVASEELEPDPGWDYTFFGDIKPEDTGREIGRYIIEHFGRFYDNPGNPGYDDITTLSLTDLSKIKQAADSFEKLAVSAGVLIDGGDYRLISRARSRTRMFGGRGEHAGETDMIDVRDLAVSLRRVLPEEAAATERDLAEAVICKYERNIGRLGGLSIYFPFENKNNLNYNLDVYRSINKLPEYVSFLDKFSYILDSRPRVNYRSAFDDIYNIKLDERQLANLYKVRQTTWRKSGLGGYIQIESSGEVEICENGGIKLNINDECVNLNGRLACLYPLDNRLDDKVNNIIEDNINIMNKRYAIPVKLNGADADLIAVYSHDYPDGKIIGAVPAGGGIFNLLDKKTVPVRQGDVISILYYCEDFDENLETSDGKREFWQVGEEFIVGGGGLVLTKEKLDFSHGRGEYFIGVSFSDLQSNKYYSNLVELKY